MQLVKGILGALLAANHARAVFSSGTTVDFGLDGAGFQGVGVHDIGFATFAKRASEGLNG